MNLEPRSSRWRAPLDRSNAEMQVKRCLGEVVSRRSQEYAALMGPATKAKPVDPVLAAIDAAPWDERPVTDEESATLAEARATDEFVDGTEVTAAIARRSKA
jgi:hypothetical protein